MNSYGQRFIVQKTRWLKSTGRNDSIYFEPPRKFYATNLHDDAVEIEFIWYRDWIQVYFNFRCKIALKILKNFQDRRTIICIVFWFLQIGVCDLLLMAKILNRSAKAIMYQRCACLCRKRRSPLTKQRYVRTPYDIIFIYTYTWRLLAYLFIFVAHEKFSHRDIWQQFAKILLF